jgi:uncharacterized membrane protein
MDSCNRFLSRLEAPNARCRVTGSLAEAGAAGSGAVDGFELDRRSSATGDARSWLVRAVLLTAHARGRHRLARTISFVLLGLVTASLVLREVFLVTTLSGRGASAFSVLVDAVLIWVSTVVTFAVWYWEIDGEGPTERTTETHTSKDLLFPQMDQNNGETAIGWSPGFLDYLFVAFTTSSAFGPTDTPVLSGRVKILTVIQTVLSLVVVIVLVAWAVGTL